MTDNMEIVRADAMGMCFGVRDALQVIDQVARPEEVTIHGELVHNREVLRMRGRLAPEARREYKRASGGSRHGLRNCT